MEEVALTLFKVAVPLVLISWIVIVTVFELTPDNVALPVETVAEIELAFTVVNCAEPPVVVITVELEDTPSLTPSNITSPFVTVILPEVVTSVNVASPVISISPDVTFVNSA